MRRAVRNERRAKKLRMAVESIVDFNRDFNEDSNETLVRLFARISISEDHERSLFGALARFFLYSARNAFECFARVNVTRVYVSK